jgi:DNA-binding response OmpR family regulator
VDKVLVVEDEGKIARTLRLYLEQAGYQVTIVQDGALAMPAFRSERPDLVILDLMLPNVDGLEICRRIRAEAGTPVIMLTARSEEVDKLVGLELGADDYVTKPFSPREVVARVKVVLRRSRGQVQPPQILRVRDLTLDLERHTVEMSGQQLELTPMEFEILGVFMRYPGRVYTRLQLLEATQGTAYEGFERAIDQHVKNLRAKLGENARDPRYILTVFGVGYRFADQDDDHA